MLDHAYSYVATYYTVVCIIMAVTFIALPSVSMGNSNNTASDAITVIMMNKLIVTVVLEFSNVCKYVINGIIYIAMYVTCYKYVANLRTKHNNMYDIRSTTI